LAANIFKELVALPFTDNMAHGLEKPVNSTLKQNIQSVSGQQKYENILLIYILCSFIKPFWNFVKSLSSASTANILK
jgi:hypothetical protein